jgi:heme/copper-type cytochrome/quinol oxidase subunit 2
MNNKKVTKITSFVFWISLCTIICCILVGLCIGLLNQNDLYGLESSATTMAVSSIFFIIMIISFMINVMSNLSTIKESLGKTDSQSIVDDKNKNGLIFWVIIIPIIIISLSLIINYIPNWKLKAQLNSSADTILQTYSNELADICDYSFTKEWIDNTSKLISRVAESDQDVRHILSIIVKDDTDEYLSSERQRGLWSWDDYDVLSENTEKEDLDEEPKKDEYVYSPSSTKEKDYLDKVFLHNYKRQYYIFIKNTGELFLPYENDGNIIVLKVLGFKNGW